MLKILGAFLVTGSCGMIGMELAKNMAKRPDELRQLQYGLQALETEIIYGATPLPQALTLVGRQTSGQVAEVFSATGRQLADGQGQTAAEAWSKVLNDTEQNLLLNSSDLNILHQFGQGLGLSDRQDQVKRLTAFRQQLSFRQKEAEAEMDRYQKVWRSLGWAVGLAITLLLF